MSPRRSLSTEASRGNAMSSAVTLSNVGCVGASCPLHPVFRYFAGSAVRGGYSQALDFAPVYVGFWNCRDDDAADVRGLGVELRDAGGAVNVTALVEQRGKGVWLALAHGVGVGWGVGRHPHAAGCRVDQRGVPCWLGVQLLQPLRCAARLVAVACIDVGGGVKWVLGMQVPSVHPTAAAHPPPPHPHPLLQLASSRATACAACRPPWRLPA
jgi:hypothetical protein